MQSLYIIFSEHVNWMKIYCVFKELNDVPCSCLLDFY